VTISQQLKIKIVLDYLSGIKREVIAKKYGISTGSVSAIAEEFEEEIPDIHKIRAMMIKLNETGNSPKTFYHAIRLYNHIKNQGLTEAQAEYILEILQDYAFKENYNISDLFNAIINAHVIAQKCGTDLEHLEDYANEKAIVSESKKALVRKLDYDIELLPYKLSINLAEFQEYKKNQPIVQNFIILANELHFEKEITKLLKDQVKTLKTDVYEKEIENGRLKQLLSQRQEKEDEYFTDYQQDTVNFDYTDLLVDDSTDVKENADSS
jgi:hypothetical protein